MKVIKTALRSRMTNDRLSDLALVYIHHDIPVSVPDAVDVFACRHTRRLEMVNMSAE